MFQVVQLRAPAPPKRILPEPYPLKKTDQVICTFDTETDPFAPGRIVKPFTCGFYDGTEYVDFWGDDCIDQFFVYLDERRKERPKEKLLIYVHNGGNFDFYFMIDHFDAGMAPFIMGGRLVRVYMHGHEFRDSYSAIPVALSVYQKDVVDYSIFEVAERNKPLNKQIIRDYQKSDCVYLHELVFNWQEMFGNKLTMASVALPMLKSYHGFEIMKPKIDNDMRPYYFGGRCQAFETGILKGDWKIYDVNSMYPFVMKEEFHPISGVPRFESKITERTHFAKIDAWSDGALPVRIEEGPSKGGLSFPIGRGTFFACIHEIKAGLETGTLRILKVHHSIYFDVQTKFDEFIDAYYKKRMTARERKEAILELFYKLVMNSSYGKFAQDPRKYERFVFDPEAPPVPLRSLDEPNGWYLHTIRDAHVIYAKPAGRESHGFYNVATAASITSAARALLLRGISQAKNPIYCDTDSLICEGLNMNLDNKALGGWKLEATGDRCAIAGKKLYAVFNDGVEVKKASKGVRLTADEIARVCAGEVIEYENPVPKFKLDGGVEFTSRKIRKTGLHSAFA